MSCGSTCWCFCLGGGPCEVNLVCTIPDALLGISPGVTGLLTRGVVLWPGVSGLFNRAESSLSVRSTIRAGPSGVDVLRDGGGAG